MWSSVFSSIGATHNFKIIRNRQSIKDSCNNWHARRSCQCNVKFVFCQNNLTIGINLLSPFLLL
jgi:hypothetical protein